MLHQEADASIDSSLLGFGQGMPPALEFIGEFDFPYHAGGMRRPAPAPPPPYEYSIDSIWR